MSNIENIYDIKAIGDGFDTLNLKIDPPQLIVNGDWISPIVRPYFEGTDLIYEVSDGYYQVEFKDDTPVQVVYIVTQSPMN